MDGSEVAEAVVEKYGVGVYSWVTVVCTAARDIVVTFSPADRFVSDPSITM
jgi:hypothetical protein